MSEKEKSVYLSLDLILIITLIIFFLSKYYHIGFAKDWDWIWVASPLFIVVGLMVGFLSFIGLILLLANIVAYINRKAKKKLKFDRKSYSAWNERARKGGRI